MGEVLDFTGRQAAERIPQRHRLGDGLWLREGRRGHTGHDPATVMIAGVPGFGFGDRAASIGVERYVLDDGGFTGRRHDRAGLGDWQVDESV